MRGSIGSLLFVLSLSSAGVVDGTEHWADLLDYDIGLAMGGIEGAVSSSNDCILVTYNRNYSTNDGQTVFLAMNLAGNLADSFEWDPPYVACYFADHSFWMTIENCKLMSDGVNAGWDQDTFLRFLSGRLLIQPGYAEIDADSQNLSSAYPSTPASLPPAVQVSSPSDGTTISEPLSTDAISSTTIGIVTPVAVTTSEGPIDDMVFALIPSGSFSMGSPLSEANRESNEGPVHAVSVQSFELMTTEVTQEMWEEVMDSNPVTEDRGNDRGVGSSYPVYNVSWDDCQQFIARLNEMDPDHVYRLPSEAEWEYACRAGTTTAYYWGEKIDGAYCWHSFNSDDENHPVAQKLPNAWGLYDMSGNVAEFCADWCYGNYSGAPTDGSAWTFPAGSYRVIRGGGSYCDSQYCRSASRFVCDPGSIVPSGLRLARSAR